MLNWKSTPITMYTEAWKSEELIETEKYIKFGEIFFIPATLGPLSGYHNLIWKQCKSFHYLALVFLSHRRLISV